MVQSIEQKFLDAAKVMNAINGNRNAIEPVQRFQNDFQDYLSYTLRRTARDENPQLVHNTIRRNMRCDFYMARIALPGLKVTFLLDGMTLHDGVSDVVFLKSTTDDRYIVLSGNSQKQNLKDGVVAYGLPFQDSAEDEIAQLLAPYTAFSTELAEKHTDEAGILDEDALLDDVAKILVPVENPNDTYREYCEFILKVWPSSGVTFSPLTP
jgi:hypothetical protein